MRVSAGICEYFGGYRGDEDADEGAAAGELMPSELYYHPGKYEN